MSDNVISPIEVEAEIKQYTLVGDDIYIKRYTNENIPDWYRQLVSDIIAQDNTITDMDAAIDYLSTLPSGYNQMITELQNADELINTSLESLVATTGSHTAAIANLQTTKVDEDSAAAIARTTIGAYFAEGSAGSWFDSEISTYASDIQSNASSITSIGAALGDQSIRIDTVEEVSIEANGWAAQASKFITDPNGKITGWQLASSNGVPSSMTVNADYFKLQDDAGNNAVMTSGGLAFYKTGVSEPFKMVAKIQTGTAVNGSTVSLTGFYDSTPIVFVSQNEITAYDSNYSAQTQKWQIRAENLVGDPSTGQWSFLAIARLILAAANTSTSLPYTYSGSSDTVYSSSFQSPSNTTAINVSGSINSYKSTGVSGNYDYRQCVCTLQTSPNNSTWTDVANQTVTHGGDLSSDLFSLYKSGLSSGVWYYRVRFVWSSTGGTFSTGVGYDYFTRVVTPADWNYSVEVGVYIADDGISTRSQTLNVTYNPIANEEVLSGNFSYSWNCTVTPSSSASGTDIGSYGELTSTSPTNTAYRQYAPLSGGSMVGSFSSSKSISTTDTSQVITAKVYRAHTPPIGYIKTAGTVSNINLTIYTRIPQSVSTTATNIVQSMSSSFSLSTTTIIDNTGTLNYLAISY